MKRVMVISRGLYPLNSGYSLHSCGLCNEINKFTDLTVFASLNNTAMVQEAYEKITEFNLHLFAYKKESRSVLSRICNSFHKPEAICKYVYPLERDFYLGILKYLNKNKADIIIIDHIDMALYFKALYKKHPEITYIYNSHNVEYLNKKAVYLDRKLFDPSIGGRLKKYIAAYRCRLHKNLEKMLIEKCNYTFCISKNDKETLEKEFNAGLTLKALKPLIRFNRIKRKEDMQSFRKVLLIIGSMNWYPNYNGIIWFIEKVFRKLMAVDSQYTLYLVGRSPTPDLINIARKYSGNIVITGEVPDTEEFFQKCDISIIPVFEGTGAKIKVLESIARGIPTICSSFAAKDYDITDELFIADTEEEFLEGIIKMSNSPDLRNDYYDKMLHYYERYFHYNQDVLSTLCEE